MIGSDLDVLSQHAIFKSFDIGDAAIFHHDAMLDDRPANLRSVPDAAVRSNEGVQDNHSLSDDRRAANFAPNQLGIALQLDATDNLAFRVDFAPDISRDPLVQHHGIGR